MRVRALAALLVVVLAGTAIGLTPTTAGAADSVTRARGDDRILTAIELSRRAFPSGGSATAAVVARDRDFADALAAAPLAVAAGGPVLLNPQDRLDEDVRAEIERLEADTVYVMGGQAAQSAEVERALKEDTASVTRVVRVRDSDHPDRFGTAAEAARRAASVWGGDTGSHVLVTLGTHDTPGRAWPDALSAGQLAGHARRPIVLVRPDGVPNATNQALADLEADTATIIGGTAAVPTAVADELAVDTVLRVGGATRYDTARLVADEAARLGASLDTVLAATGAKFADGLAAGPAAVHLGGVLALVHPAHLADSPHAHDWLADHRATIGDIVVAGGPAAVSDAVVGHLEAATSDLSQLSLRWEEVVPDLDSPLDVEVRAGDARIYVAERGGRVWQTFPDGGKNLFLDIRDRVVQADDERGLLGIAFHPERPNRLFAYYTRAGADDRTRLSEFRVVGDVADETTEATLAEYDQPFANHNGGGLEFAPDGTLWLALGDGGDGNDPHGHGQNTQTELGSLLRYVVLGAAGDWTTPDDNPFASGGGRPTIAHHGLRNPFRFAFDPIDERVFIGDVGESRREEIDVVDIADLGHNFGWDCKEGTLEGEEPTNCDSGAVFTPPVREYPTDPEGGTCAVTGGVVYRGHDLPELAGTYLYADFCEGLLRGFRMTSDGVTEARVWPGVDAANPAGFGTDHRGEVYVADLSGRLLKLVRG